MPSAGSQPSPIHQALTSLSALNADRIKVLLVKTHDELTPMSGLVDTAKLCFHFIQQSSLSVAEKNAFYQQEKQFNFYESLARE